MIRRSQANHRHPDKSRLINNLVQIEVEKLYPQQLSLYSREDRIQLFISQISINIVHPSRIGVEHPRLFFELYFYFLPSLILYEFKYDLLSIRVEILLDVVRI